MSRESYGSYEEKTPTQLAEALAEEIWGSQYDQDAMRRDGRDPYWGRYDPDAYKYRKWGASDVEGVAVVIREGQEYAYDQAGKGFRRIRKDEAGMRQGLGTLFGDKEGFDRLRSHIDSQL